MTEGLSQSETSGGAVRYRKKPVEIEAMQFDGSGEMPDLGQFVCRLGHRQRSYECPACAEALGHGEQSIEHWRWFRSRTSSKVIKAAIGEYLTARQTPSRGQSA